MTRVTRSLVLGVATVAGAALLLSSRFAVSGASATLKSSLAGHESALGAFATRGPVDVPDGMWFDAPTGTVRGDALETDARLMAESEGLGVDDAVGRLTAQQRMDGILGKAQDLYPELVGIRWVDGRVVAQVKGEAPKGVLELLSTSGAEVEYESVRYSRSELEQLQADLGKALGTMGVADYVVAVDPVGQRIIASVSSGNGARMSNGAAISEQTIDAALPSKLADANVDIQVVDGPVSQATTTYGGTEARAGTTFICTHGFTVSNGVSDGVATDAHCGSGLNSYRDWVTGITHSMTYKAGHLGQWGDFEWFTTTGTEVDDFYTEGGSRRDVSGVLITMSKGQELLWYGRSTKNDWLSWVEYPLINTSGPGRLACLYHYHVVGGDSGGPVYINNTAAGFVWGWVSIDGARRDCFSQARHIDDALGLGIKW